MGKSHYGQLLAKLCARAFVDTDSLIEKRFGKEQEGCREIAARIGEANFRLYEYEVISSLAGVQSAVIAIGGGALLYPPSAKLLSKLGKIIYLKIDKQMLKEQCSLPVFFDSADFERMYQEREPVYAEWADFTIFLEGKTQEEVLRELPFFLGGKEKNSRMAGWSG